MLSTLLTSGKVLLSAAAVAMTASTVGPATFSPFAVPTILDWVINCAGAATTLCEYDIVFAAAATAGTTVDAMFGLLLSDVVVIVALLEPSSGKSGLMMSFLLLLCLMAEFIAAATTAAVVGGLLFAFDSEAGVAISALLATCVCNCSAVLLAVVKEVLMPFAVTLLLLAVSRLGQRSAAAAAAICA